MRNDFKLASVSCLVQVANCHHVGIVGPLCGPIIKLLYLDSCGTISDGKSFSVCQHEALINICIVIVCEIVI